MAGAHEKQENAVRRATYDPLGEHGPSIERFPPRVRAGDRDRWIATMQ
jgi:hypothetical protein